MALPSIVLTLAFAGGLFAACIASLQSGLAVVGGAFLVTAGMGLHWKRFRVPIAVAVGAAAVVGIVIGSLVAFWPDARAWLLTLCFARSLRTCVPRSARGAVVIGKAVNPRFRGATDQGGPNPWRASTARPAGEPTKRTNRSAIAGSAASASAAIG